MGKFQDLTKPCGYYGKEFLVRTRYKAEGFVNSSRKFCSSNCRKKGNREYSLNWKMTHPSYFNQRRFKVRPKIILMYGSRCECCGLEDEAFLTIDHLNGRSKDRLSPALEYARILREKPQDIHILCMNCNHLLGKIFRSTGIHKRFCPVHHSEDMQGRNLYE